MKSPFVPARLAELARREVGVLTIVLAIAVALLAFLAIADEVMEGETGAFDEAILLSLRVPTDHHDPLGPRWLEQAAGDVTALGSVTVLAIITFAAIGFLLADGKPRTALLVVASIGGGTLLSTLMKLGYGRPRPDLVPHAVEVYTASFPSGHALGAAVVFLTLGGLLSWSQPRRRIKIYILSTAVVLTILVGVSRVYLGVHWPTDVLAGWTIGAAWALAWSGVALVLARRTKSSPPGEGPAG